MCILESDYARRQSKGNVYYQFADFAAIAALTSAGASMEKVISPDGSNFIAPHLGRLSNFRIQ
jgi:hypothetical protein